MIGLQDCLESAEAPSKLRSAILDALTFTIRTDISELGGLGASEGVADMLVNSATPEERLAIAQTLRADIDQANIKTKGEARQFRSHWSQEKLGLIVLKLLDNQLDDTAYLTLPSTIAFTAWTRIVISVCYRATSVAFERLEPDAALSCKSSS